MSAPVELPLSSEASDAFEDWQVENRQVDEDASGLFKSFTGKMDGLVLRLALVGELVRWAWRGGAEPERVSLEALIAAIMFVEDYAKPMALRTYGDAALPQVERNAALLARYIRKEGSPKINTRTLKQSPHKARLWVEKHHSADGHTYIDNRIADLESKDETEGARLWRRVADCYKRLRTGPIPIYGQPETWPH